MFSRIVLPTDGSRHSLESARLAARLARVCGAEISPIVCVEYDILESGELAPEIVETIRERIRARAQRALVSVAEVIAEEGATQVAGRVIEGPAPESIVEFAASEMSDLIVIGSRGVSEQRGHIRLMGSVAERVLHAAPCPVLVIRAEPTTKP